MTMLSPAAMYHAELKESLGGLGRAITAQRALIWLARGLVLGVVLDLGLVIWAWTREAVTALPVAMLVGAPVAIALLAAIGSMLVRQDVADLARRVDRAAGLHERSVTALELGGRGEEFPLAIAQMRDTVEHLKRLDPLEAFPMRVPRKELTAAGVLALVTIIIGVSPNPWLLQARAANPAITAAREQAQRVERLADSIRVDETPELQELRDIISKGARTIEARSAEPESALGALEDLEETIRQMSAGDDQLAAALAAVSSALAGDATTEPLAAAINTGDMREISRAARTLGQQTEELEGQDRERVAKVLRDASNRAGRASPTVASQLADAADAMDGGGEQGEGAEGQQMRQGAEAGQPSGARSSQNGRSASESLNELGNNAAAAAERQRAQSQLEGSRNALERALGRTQSRSTSGRSSAGSQRGQRGAAGEQGAAGAAGQAGEGGEAGEGGQQGEGAGGMGGQNGENGEPGQGGGYSTGGQSQNKTGAYDGIDTITRPEQLDASGLFAPDQTSDNPYLGEAGEGTVNAGDESVAPAFTRKTTQGGDTGAIPLGLRDLVKDYFTSLDQR